MVNINFNCQSTLKKTDAVKNRIRDITNKFGRKIGVKRLFISNILLHLIDMVISIRDQSF